MREDLSQDEQDRLAGQLHALAQQLREALARSDVSAQPVELDQTRVGRVSRGDALQQQAMAQAGRRVLQQRLHAVHGALQRLQQGHYGDCIDCDEPITLARLQRQPEAARCIACQSARE